jgi:glycosyltransferase involved in cell wall biosynthesis
MRSTRTALLIAFHYPPCSASSGLQRSLAFSRHLPEHGWNTVVLTVTPGAHERVTAQPGNVPPNVIVARSLALDAARHLAIRGRYWSALALPDRWSNWWLSAVPRGLRLIREHAIDVIWSTYPIATAHRIGTSLAQRSGKPWIADFRDPMIEYIPETGETYPKDPALREARARIEQKVVERAECAVFCTEAARVMMQQRYPNGPLRQFEMIPNGFDEQAFLDAEALPRTTQPRARRLLLHSGTIYPGPDRDPSAAFAAIRALAARGVLGPESFELRLRDPSNTDYFQALAQKHEIAAMVTIAPPLPYREALAEMLGADGLLLLQGATSNPAIPAKVYEYFRARRPIVALVHPAGETAATLRNAGIASQASLTDSQQIGQLLEEWLAAGNSWAANIARPEAIAKFSRRTHAAQLAALFDQVTTRRGS